MARRVRFELTEPVKVRQFSKLLHSASMRPSRIIEITDSSLFKKSLLLLLTDSQILWLVTPIMLSGGHKHPASLSITSTA